MQIPQFTKQQQQTLRTLGITTVYLFGSHAEGTAGPGSDVDVAVLVHNPKTQLKDTLVLYNALYDLFSDVFDLSGLKTIDIVFLEHSVSMELQAHVVKKGVVLFDDDPHARADYEARVMIQMADLIPYRRIFDSAILARI